MTQQVGAKHSGRVDTVKFIGVSIVFGFNRCTLEVSDLRSLGGQMLTPALRLAVADPGMAGFGHF